MIEGLRAAGVTADISVDTSKASVAAAALDAGATLVNDVTALRGDPEMAALVADRAVPCVLMHMRGEPGTMQRDPRYADVVGEVTAFLRGRVWTPRSRRASTSAGCGSTPGSASARRSSTTSSCCAGSTRSWRSGSRC